MPNYYADDFFLLLFVTVYQHKILQLEESGCFLCPTEVSDQHALP